MNKFNVGDIVEGVRSDGRDVLVGRWYRVSAAEDIFVGLEGTPYAHLPIYSASRFKLIQATPSPRKVVHIEPHAQVVWTTTDGYLVTYDDGSAEFIPESK